MHHHQVESISVEFNRRHRRLDTLVSWRGVLSQLYDSDNVGAPQETTPTKSTPVMDNKHRKSHRRSSPILSCEDLSTAFGTEEEPRQEHSPPFQNRSRTNSSSSGGTPRRRARPSRAIRSPSCGPTEIPSPLAPPISVLETKMSPHVDTQILGGKVDARHDVFGAASQLDMPRLNHFPKRVTSEVKQKIKSVGSRLTTIEIPCHLLATLEESE